MGVPSRPLSGDAPQTLGLVMLFGIQARPLSLSCQTCHSLLTVVQRAVSLSVTVCSLWSPSTKGVGDRVSFVHDISPA